MMEPFRETFRRYPKQKRFKVTINNFKKLEVVKRVDGKWDVLFCEQNPPEYFLLKRVISEHETETSAKNAALNEALISHKRDANALSMMSKMGFTNKI